MAKLSKREKVLEFYSQHPEMSYRQIAKELGVGKTTAWEAINNIRHKRKYKPKESKSRFKYINGIKVGKKAIDYTGQQINPFLFADELTPKKDNYNRLIWKCHCIKNYNFEFTSLQLWYKKKAKLCKNFECKKKCEYNLDGHIEGFGKKSFFNNNYIGQKYGFLTIIEGDTKKDDQNHLLVPCVCDCNKNKIIYKRFDHLLKGHVQSCGCLNSKGEKDLAKILFASSLLFKKEYTFENCINSKTSQKLRFDFYLPDYNICIEYDGEQHFEETKWTHSSLEEIQYRDNIKNNYCKEHNIKLIRIPYWDYNRLNEEYIQKALQCPLMDLSKTF